jgi:hypothetical protein
MPKRKAVESPSSEEDSPPKNARQKRQEAKARAREWAEREANKKAAAPNIKVKITPTQKKTTPAKKTRRTPSKKESPVKSPEPAKKKQKLNSGKVKLSKKQQIAEAKARAQEWADKQKQVDEKKAAKTASTTKEKKPAASQKKSPVPNASPETTAAAKSPTSAAASRVAADTARGPVGMNTTAATAQAQLEMMMAQEQQAMARAQAENNAWAARMQQMSPEQQHQFYHNQVMQNAAMAIYGQPAWGNYAPPANYPYNGNYPPVASPPLMNAAVASPSLRRPVHNDNASRYLGSPPAVNAAPRPATATVATTKATSPTRPRRAAAKKQAPALALVEPAPAVSPPYEIPPEDGDEVSVVQQDDVEQEGTAAQAKHFRFLPVSVKGLILPAIVAIGAYFALLRPGASKPSESLQPVKPPCFLADPDQAAALFNCDKSKGILPCPQGGVCSGGELKSCVDPRMTVAETRDRCVLSAETNETLAKVEALLSEWTVEQTCSLAGAVHSIKNPDSRAPFFDVSLVQEQIDVSYDTLALSDSFALVSGSGESLIGLADDYMDNELVVPLWCYCGLWAFTVAETILGMVLFVATLVTEVLWNMTVAFPLISVSLVLILWAAYAIRKNRKERMQLRQEVATVRDLTYDKLYEDRKVDHFAIHLRDEVAHDLYPTSRTKRSYIINTVWPRVVADVKQDNRVLKSTKMLLGTPRDVWQWTASSTPAKNKNGVDN